MSVQEISTDRDIDRAVALTFIILVIVSFYCAVKASDLLVRVELLASIPLNLMASISFITRESALEGAHRNEILIPALSFIGPFLVLNNILLFPEQYSTAFGLLIAVPGVVLACSSLLILRRSFSILPAVRTLANTGPYRFVRHPLYLGESIYLFGMMLLAFNLLSIILMVLTLILLVFRIRIEERKLSSFEDYRKYMDMVQFKMIPGLF